MPLQFVGQTSGSGTAASYTVSLNGTLTGGIASSPSPGDLIVVWSAFGNTASSAPTVTGNNNGAYSSPHAALHVNDTWDTEFRTFYDVQGATVDTQLTVGRVNNAAYGGATVVQVWRGADQTTPIGGNNIATITNGSRVGFGAVTPTIAGSVIVAGAAGTQGTTGSAFTGPANMTSANSIFSNGTTSDIGVLSSYYDAWTSGSFTPNTITGGATSTSSSGASSTTVINPAPIHDTDGTLTGPGSSIVGSSTHLLFHETSGALSGQTSSLVGSANRSPLFITHVTSGNLVGQSSLISGSASRVHVFSSSGALTGQGAILSGSALRFAIHLTSGILVGQGSSVVGSTLHNYLHTSTGTLQSQGSLISGSTSRYRQHGTSGNVTGQGSSLQGFSEFTDFFSFGFRVLENGDFRVTEADHNRITEQFNTAEFSGNATSSVYALVPETHYGFADIQTEGIFSITPILYKVASVSISASSQATSSGIKVHFGNTNLNSTSSSDYLGFATLGGLLNVTSVGSSSFYGGLQYVGNSNLTTTGSIAYFGLRRVQGLFEAIVPGELALDDTLRCNGLLNAIGSAQASYSPQRTTYGLLALSATTSMASLGYNIEWRDASIFGNSTLTAQPYESIMYNNINGTWGEGFLYVKYNNTWQRPTGIYVKQSGSWVRAN